MGFYQNFSGLLESAIQLREGRTTLEAIKENSISLLRTNELEIVTSMQELTRFGMTLPSLEGFQRELAETEVNLQNLREAFLASSVFRLGWRGNLSKEVLVCADFQQAISSLSLSRRKVWQVLQHIERLARVAHPLGLLADVGIDRMLKRVLRETLDNDPEFKAIEFQLELSSVSTTCDELRIYLLLNELVTNAIGSMMRRNPGGRLEWIPGLREHKIVIRTAILGEDILISIRDTSHGIPAEELHYVGFFGASALISTNTIGGMGIGLAEGKQTAEQHGGTLCVQSSTSGTEVVVKLPRIAPPYRL